MRYILFLLAFLLPIPARAADLEARALALMVAKAPPEKVAALPAFPGWQETAAERLARYQGIAKAAVTVGKSWPRIATILAVSFHESGWARDVDLGPCYRGKDGKGSRCDSGRAACMMQVRTDVHRQWKSGDLFVSREACFKAGLEIIERSQRACLKLGPSYRFDVYAGGWCQDGHALTMGHERGLELVSLSDRFAAWRE